MSEAIPHPGPGPGPRPKGPAKLRELRVGQDFRTLVTLRPGTVMARPKGVDYIMVELEDAAGEWRQARLHPDCRVLAF